MTTLSWVESAGGPLVVIERASAQHWSGYHGHYERACEMEDVLGVITIDSTTPPFDVLVLGDEPLRTTFLRERNAILQWIYAPSEEAFLSSVLALNFEEVDWEEGLTVPIGGSVEIFDAALPRGDAGGGDVLSVELPGLSQLVMSSDVNLDAKISARIHRFISS